MRRMSGAVLAAGMVLIVASDGTPLWRVVRVVFVVGACVLVVAAETTLSPGAARIAVVVVGTIGTTVGGVIGYTHLAANGLSTRGAAGLLVFAGGLTLLAPATADLVRSVRGWRRLLAVPVVVIVGYCVVLPVSVAVYATNVPRPELGGTTPGDHGLKYVDVTLATHDGVSLSGWYIPSANRAAVVLLHGASSTRSNVLAHAVVLARNGYGVLLFDARGHGGSGGRAMEFGWYGDRDVVAAVDYLRRRPDVDPARVGTVGMSMGGEEAIGAMAADRRIMATVAEGATGRTSADKAWLAHEYGARGRLQQGVDWLTYGLADLLTAASPPRSLRDAVVAAAPRRVFLIAGGAVRDEVRADRAIRAASPSSVELWVVPGARHTGGLRNEPRQWERTVTAFLGRALLGEVGSG